MKPEIKDRQIDRWLEHARATEGHHAVGPTVATFDHSPLWSIIYCHECPWQYEDKQAAEAIKEGEQACSYR